VLSPAFAIPTNSSLLNTLGLWHTHRYSGRRSGIVHSTIAGWVNPMGRTGDGLQIDNGAQMG